MTASGVKIRKHLKDKIAFKNNMKIIFDPQIFGWQKYGGISRYYTELASRLRVEHEDQVTIVAPIYVNKYLRNVDSGILKVMFSAIVFRFSGRLYRALNMFISRYIVSLGAMPDIIHETYFYKGNNLIKGKKRIITVFDMIHEKYPENFSKFDPTRQEKY